MLSPFTLVVISIIYIGCCVACGRVANKKGRNPIPYAILGMGLPVIGLIVVLTRSNLNTNPVTVMQQAAVVEPEPVAYETPMGAAESEPEPKLEKEFESKPVEVRCTKEKEKVDYAKLIMHKDSSLDRKRIRLDIIDSRTGELYQRIGYRENAAFVNIKNIEPGKYRFALWIHDVFYNKFEWRVAAETYMTVEPGEEYDIRLSDRIIRFEGYTTEEVVETEMKEDKEVEPEMKEDKEVEPEMKEDVEETPAPDQVIYQTALIDPEPEKEFEFKPVEVKYTYVSEGYDRKRYYIYPVEVRENIFEEDTDYPQLRGIFKLAAKIGKFITERNDKLLSIKIGGGSTEVSHTGDVAFDASYSSLSAFVNNFNRDYEKAKEDAEREYGSWFSGLNFHYIRVCTPEYVVDVGNGVKVEIPVSAAQKDGWKFLADFVQKFEDVGSNDDAGAEELFWDEKSGMLGRKIRLNEKGGYFDPDYYLTAFVDDTGEITRYDFEYSNKLFEIAVEQMDIINKYLNEKSKQQYEQDPVTSMCMYVQAMKENAAIRIYDIALADITSRLVDAKRRHEMKIISKKQKEYKAFNEIDRYYRYDRFDGIYYAKSILDLLNDAGAEFRKFSRPADYVDHCDYNMTHKYDDYEDFLKGGGLAFSLEEPYSSIDFSFTFDGILMSGHIHESGSFINKAFYRDLDEDGREKAEKALDKVQDIVKEVYL